MCLSSLLVAAALVAGSGQQPCAREDRSYATVGSLDRVRAALDKPPSKLTLPETRPDFSVDILERERFYELVKPMLDFTVGPGVPQSALFASPFGSQPLVKIDLMAVAVATASAVNTVRKAYLKRAAREQVLETIAAYCAAQPDRGVGIRICDRF